MAFEKLVQTGEDENGIYNSMTGLDFVKALNKNADELGTETKLDLEVHNTPEAIAKALKEQAGKIGWHTPGGPDDLPTHEEEGAPVNSPSNLEDGLAQIYNKALEGGEPEPEPADPDIDCVTINIEQGLIEGKDNVKSGAKVATVEVDGGTEPFTYSANGGEHDNKFNLDSKNITTKEDLEEGTYNIKIKVQDSKGKEGSAEASIKVEAESL